MNAKPVLVGMVGFKAGESPAFAGGVGQRNAFLPISKKRGIGVTLACFYCSPEADFSRLRDIRPT
jgi:hypothetical protein